MAKEMILVDPAMWTALNNNKSDNNNNNAQSAPISNNIATRVVQQTDKDIDNILIDNISKIFILLIILVIYL